MAFSKKVIKILCFDFDGTVIESNDIKDAAFGKIFSEFPKHKKLMMDYHLNNNSIDRHQKFSFFVNNILKDKKKNVLVEELVEKFNVLTEKSINKCAYVEGVILFLEDNFKKIDFYLLSATPEMDLHRILNYRKINRYFKFIYGAPLNKVDVLNNIIIKKNIKADEILYIGDTQEDLEAAHETKVNFIHRQSDRKLKENKYPSFKDFESIAKYVKSNFNFIKL